MMRRADYKTIIRAVKLFRMHFNAQHPDTTKEQNDMLKEYNERTIVPVLCEQLKESNPAFSKDLFLKEYEKQ